MGIFDKIEHKFLVVGHSFSAADRDFAQVEKRWKTSKAEVMNDVKDVIHAARVQKPFKTLDMTGQFFEFKEVSKNLINTLKLEISKAAWICIEKENLGVVKIKTTFNEAENWKCTNVLKKGVNVNSLASSTFSKLPEHQSLKESKKSDVRQIIPFLKEENKMFFENLLAV